MDTTLLKVSGSGINSYQLNGDQLTLDYNGLLNIYLINISNPTLYDGSRSWSVSCTDTNNYLIEAGTAQQVSEYLPASATIAINLANSAIEQNTTAVISLTHSLAHQSSDYILVRFNNATVLNGCLDTNCSLLSSTIIKLPYISTLQQFTTQILTATVPNSYMCNVEFYTSSGILLENGSTSYQLNPMTYTFTSSFAGFVGQSGTLNINMTTRPSTLVALNYSVGNIFQSSVCNNCNSSTLYLTGTVLYFVNSTIQITGLVGNVVYAQGNLTISYPCSAGCQICTANACTQCFNSTYTNLIYFYNGSCLSQCPASTYVTSTNCASCQANCYQCTPATCTVCSSGYYMYNASCVDHCPDGYAVVGAVCELKPIVCSTGCQSCITSDKCIKCSDGYSLYESACYVQCPNSTISMDGICVPAPVLPVETTHFPFPFALTAVSLLVILLFFKLIDKRSVILGNFISLCTLLELGSMLMFLAYDLMDKRDLVNQLLTYLTIFSKVACNIFMLVYFIKKISQDEKFEEWL
jgi:hypothetical protein